MRLLDRSRRRQPSTTTCPASPTLAARVEWAPDSACWRQWQMRAAAMPTKARKCSALRSYRRCSRRARTQSVRRPIGDGRAARRARCHGGRCGGGFRVCGASGAGGRSLCRRGACRGAVGEVHAGTGSAGCPARAVPDRGYRACSRPRYRVLRFSVGFLSWARSPLMPGFSWRSGSRTSARPQLCTKRQTSQGTSGPEPPDQGVVLVSVPSASIEVTL